MTSAFCLSGYDWIIFIFSSILRRFFCPHKSTLIIKGGDCGVKQVVYVDVLVALNVILSFFLIKSVCALMHEKPKSLRVLWGSLLGGTYSLVIFLPQMHSAVTVIGRTVFLLAVTSVVFGFGDLRRFLRCFCLLCAVSLLCAGAVTAAWLLILPDAFVVRNGSFYVDISFVELVVVCALVYVVARVFGMFLAKRSSEEMNVRLTIFLGGKSVSTNGIIDTGNTLCDSFTGEPVSVISQSLALSLLPAADVAAATDPMRGNIPEGMHLVVSDTVGSSAIMCAFKADSMVMASSDKQAVIRNVTLAVSPRETFAGGKNVLVNCTFIDNIQGGRDIDEKTRSTHKTCKARAHKARNLLHKRPRNPACTSDGCAGKGSDEAH